MLKGYRVLAVEVIIKKLVFNNNPGKFYNNIIIFPYYLLLNLLLFLKLNILFKAIADLVILKNKSILYKDPPTPAIKKAVVKIKSCNKINLRLFINTPLDS